MNKYNWSWEPLKVSGSLSIIDDSDNLEIVNMRHHSRSDTYTFDIKRVDGYPMRAYLDDLCIKRVYEDDEPLTVDGSLIVNIPYFNCKGEFNSTPEAYDLPLDNLSFKTTIDYNEEISLDNPQFDISGDNFTILGDKFIDNVTIQIEDDVLVNYIVKSAETGTTYFELIDNEGEVISLTYSDFEEAIDDYMDLVKTDTDTECYIQEIQPVLRANFNGKVELEYWKIINKNYLTEIMKI